MHTSKISVLIPVYNRESTIAQCINSVMANNYEDLEIIVSDNASTDSTVDIVKNIAITDKRLILLTSDNNFGPISNWEKCLNRASGTLVHWMWSDDWVDPNFYSTLTQGMSERSAQVGIAAARIINTQENWWHIVDSHPNAPIPKDIWLRNLIGGIWGPLSPAAALLPLESCRRHFTHLIPVSGSLNCNKTAIGCDAIMIIGAIHDAKRVYSHPEPLVNFRHHSDSITLSSGMKLVRAHYAWARSYWSKKNGYPKKYRLRDAARLLASGHVTQAIVAIV